MSMAEFVLSLDTRLAGAQDTAILYAWRDLRRDLGGTHFGENNVEITFSPEMRPESYTVEVLEDRVCVQAVDTLGAVYAIYSLSERALGIRPLDYFLGVKREATCGKLKVGDHWESPVFRVRYRGWFVNDEVLLDGWHTENSGKKALWERIFETLLRCGGNMIIP
ncbi:MAG: glycosyl hydrolase 115 family protein, partial [Clostridia bacterium]|nr:glycosyl hydrolase 115 family protein [Clostridia bacterium]